MPDMCEWWTYDRIAAYLGLPSRPSSHRTQIVRLIRRYNDVLHDKRENPIGQLRVGNRVMFRRSDVERMAESLMEPV